MQTVTAGAAGHGLTAGRGVQERLMGYWNGWLGRELNDCPVSALLPSPNGSIGNGHLHLAAELGTRAGTKSRTRPWTAAAQDKEGRKMQKNNKEGSQKVPKTPCRCHRRVRE